MALRVLSRRQAAVQRSLRKYHDRRLADPILGNQAESGGPPDEFNPYGGRDAISQWASDQSQALNDLFNEAWLAGVANFRDQFGSYVNEDEDLDPDQDSDKATIMALHNASIGKMAAQIGTLALLAAPQIIEWFDANEKRIDQQAETLAWAAEQKGYKEAGAGKGLLIYWELDPDADHCGDCPDLANGSPYTDENGDNPLPQFPGDGGTDCGPNCRCSLNYVEPDNIGATGGAPAPIDTGGLGAAVQQVLTGTNAAVGELGAASVHDLEGANLDATLLNLKAKLRNVSGKEYAFNLDNRGRIIYAKAGDEARVNMTNDEISLHKYGVAIHNHPADNSFSPTDVAFAHQAQLRELHVVGPYHDYVLKPAQGYFQPQMGRKVLDVAEAVAQKRLDELHAEVSAIFKRQLQGDLPFGKFLTADEIWQRVSADYWHNVWTDVAQRFGYIYERIDKGGVSAVPMIAKKQAVAVKGVAEANVPKLLSDDLPTLSQLNDPKLYEKISGPTGSNPAQWYKDKSTGQTYIAKQAKDEERAYNEAGMANVYYALGADPGVEMPLVGVRAYQGKWYVVSEGIPGVEAKTDAWWASAANKTVRDDARKLWAVDALTSNWDVYGLNADNLLVAKGGYAVRIDAGGAGMFRAMGAPKPEFNIGKPWNEPWTMRAIAHGGAPASNQVAPVFGGMTHQQAAEALEDLKNKLTDGVLDNINGQFLLMGMPQDMRTRIIDTLKYRRDLIPQIEAELGYTPNTSMDSALMQQFKATGGFTYEALTGAEPVSGYVVAAFPERGAIFEADEFTEAKLAQFEKDNADLLAKPGLGVGAWANPEDGKVYLDVVTIEQDQAVAIQKGIAANQVSIYDVVNKKTIPTGGSGTIPAKLTPVVPTTQPVAAPPKLKSGLPPKWIPQGDKFAIKFSKGAPYAADFVNAFTDDMNATGSWARLATDDLEAQFPMTVKKLGWGHERKLRLQVLMGKTYNLAIEGDWKALQTLYPAKVVDFWKTRLLEGAEATQPTVITIPEAVHAEAQAAAKAGVQTVTQTAGVPTLQDAAVAWIGDADTAGAIRHASGADADLTRYQQAKALTEGIVNAKPDGPELWRGLKAPFATIDDAAKWYSDKALEPGAGGVLNLGLNSFSQSGGIAGLFAGTPGTGEKFVPVIYHLKPGARALDLTGYEAKVGEEAQAEKEWLSAGQFKIDKVHVEKGPYGEQLHVDLEQIGVASAPEDNIGAQYIVKAEDLVSSPAIDLLVSPEKLLTASAKDIPAIIGKQYEEGHLDRQQAETMLIENAHYTPDAAVEQVNIWDTIHDAYEKIEKLQDIKEKIEGPGEILAGTAVAPATDENTPDFLTPPDKANPDWLKAWLVTVGGFTPAEVAKFDAAALEGLQKGLESAYQAFVASPDTTTPVAKAFFEQQIALDNAVATLPTASAAGVSPSLPTVEAWQAAAKADGIVIPDDFNPYAVATTTWKWQAESGFEQAANWARDTLAKFGIYDLPTLNAAIHKYELEHNLLPAGLPKLPKLPPSFYAFGKTGPQGVLWSYNSVQINDYWKKWIGGDAIPQSVKDGFEDYAKTKGFALPQEAAPKVAAPVPSLPDGWEDKYAKAVGLPALGSIGAEKVTTVWNHLYAGGPAPTFAWVDKSYVEYFAKAGLIPGATPPTPAELLAKWPVMKTTSSEAEIRDDLARWAAGKQTTNWDAENSGIAKWLTEQGFPHGYGLKAEAVIPTLPTVDEMQALPFAKNAGYTYSPANILGFAKGNWLAKLAGTDLSPMDADLKALLASKGITDEATMQQAIDAYEAEIPKVVTAPSLTKPVVATKPTVAKTPKISGPMLPTPEEFAAAHAQPVNWAKDDASYLKQISNYSKGYYGGTWAWTQQPGQGYPIIDTLKTFGIQNADDLKKAIANYKKAKAVAAKATIGQVEEGKIGVASVAKDANKNTIATLTSGAVVDFGASSINQAALWAQQLTTSINKLPPVLANAAKEFKVVPASDWQHADASYSKGVFYFRKGQSGFFNQPEAMQLDRLLNAVGIKISEDNPDWWTEFKAEFGTSLGIPDYYGANSSYLRQYFTKVYGSQANLYLEAPATGQSNYYYGNGKWVPVRAWFDAKFGGEKYVGAKEKQISKLVADYNGLYGKTETDDTIIPNVLDKYAAGDLLTPDTQAIHDWLDASIPAASPLSTYRDKAAVSKAFKDAPKPGTDISVFEKFQEFQHTPWAGTWSSYGFDSAIQQFMQHAKSVQASPTAHMASDRDRWFIAAFGNGNIVNDIAPAPSKAGTALPWLAQHHSIVEQWANFVHALPDEALAKYGLTAADDTAEGLAGIIDRAFEGGTDPHEGGVHIDIAKWLAQKVGALSDLPETAATGGILKVSGQHDYGIFGVVEGTGNAEKVTIPTGVYPSYQNYKAAFPKSIQTEAQYEQWVADKAKLWSDHPGNVPEDIGNWLSDFYSGLTPAVPEAPVTSAAAPMVALPMPWTGKADKFAISFTKQNPVWWGDFKETFSGDTFVTQITSDLTFPPSVLSNDAELKKLRTQVAMARTYNLALQGQWDELEAMDPKLKGFWETHFKEHMTQNLPASAVPGGEPGVKAAEPEDLTPKMPPLSEWQKALDKPGISWPQAVQWISNVGNDWNVAGNVVPKVAEMLAKYHVTDGETLLNLLAAPSVVDEHLDTALDALKATRDLLKTTQPSWYTEFREQFGHDMTWKVVPELKDVVVADPGSTPERTARAYAFAKSYLLAKNGDFQTLLTMDPDGNLLKFWSDRSVIMLPAPPAEPKPTLKSLRGLAPWAAMLNSQTPIDQIRAALKGTDKARGFETFYETAGSWKGGSQDSVRQASKPYARGKWDTPNNSHYAEGAKQVLAAIADAPGNAPILWRNQDVPSSSPIAKTDWWEARIGKTMDLDVSGFTDHRDAFNSSANFQFELKPKSNGVNISYFHDYGSEHEWLWGGRYKVVGVRKEPHRIVVEIEQVAPFAVPDDFDKS